MINKKNISKYLLFYLVLSIAFISSYFLPWWVGPVVAFLLAILFGNTSVNSFLSGFFALTLVWIVVALLKSLPNGNILASRVSLLFHLHRWIYLLILTGFIGGLTGGLAALSGFLLKKAFSSNAWFLMSRLRIWSWQIIPATIARYCM